MKKFLCSVLALFSAVFIYAQHTDEYKLWDEGKITVSDFQMVTKIPESVPCLAHYSVDIAPIRGFNFYKKNYNEFVENIMLKKASWLDTLDQEIDAQLRYQQLYFDLNEVYARTIRRLLIENKKEIVKGNNKLNLKLEQLRNEHAKLKAQMESETEGGQNIDEVQKWEDLISEMLNELHLFRYGYSGKLNISKAD